jgi:hypothetical protein
LKLKGALKGMAATLSDYEEEDEEKAYRVRAFSRTFETDSFSNDDLIEEELAEAQRKTNAKFEELCLSIEREERINKVLTEDKNRLLSTVSTLEDENTFLNSNLTNMLKNVRMMNKGTKMLDDMLETGRIPGDTIGLGFDNQYKEEVKATPKKKESLRKKIQEKTFDQMSQHHAQQQPQHPARLKKLKSDNMSHHHAPQRNSHLKSKQGSAKRCSRCGKIGHIQSECFKKRADIKKNLKKKIKPKNKRYQEVSQIKNGQCLTAKKEGNMTSQKMSQHQYTK